jgi:hypothetical protein
MLHNHRVIIQKWHIVEETYDHGKIILYFFDKPTIIIDNFNEQKFLICYVDGTRLYYTHIESFVNDFAHLLNNVRHILIDECNGKNKRKNIFHSHNVMSHCIKKLRTI